MGQTKIDRAIQDFIVLPVIVLVGIYVTASLIDSMLLINNETFRIIFTCIGGVPFFIYYFKRKLAQYMG
jgi:ABC-type Fe3+-siderophore transport system permease subunit